jgi:hypothetical protein
MLMANDILKGKSAPLSKKILNEISINFKLAKVYFLVASSQ